MLGCDSLVASGDLALNVMHPERTRVIVNTHEQITGQFARDPDLAFPTDSIVERIKRTAGAGNVQLLDATRIATRLLGDAIASNLFLLGFAYQRGLVPVSGVAIERAIELNGVAVEMNREAFRWGRRAGRDLAAVEDLALQGDEGLEPPAPKSLDEFVERRVVDLTEWQNAAWAARYRSLVERVREAEGALGTGGEALAGAVARFAYKLMAYKDEYEVARLYTDGAFRERLAARFEGDLRVTFHMAPPLLARPDPVTGEARKRTYGPWMWRVLALVAKMRGLRGNAVRHLRAQRGAAHGAPAHRGVLRDRGGTARRPSPREPRLRRRPRLRPRPDKGLRPRQGAQRRRGRDGAGGASRALAALAGGGEAAAEARAA